MYNKGLPVVLNVYLVASEALCLFVLGTFHSLPPVERIQNKNVRCVGITLMLELFATCRCLIDAANYFKTLLIIVVARYRLSEALWPLAFGVLSCFWS